MTVSAHMNNLVEEHQKLEMQIQQAYNHFAPDSNVTELKKRKLSIKQKIAALKAKQDDES